MTKYNRYRKAYESRLDILVSSILRPKEVRSGSTERMSANAIRVTRDISGAVLTLLFCFFMISFITPYWFHKHRELTQLRVFHGLWRLCDVYLKACFQIVGSAINKPWLKWTQALMIVDLFAYVAAVGFYSHWMTKSLSYLEKHGLGWPGGMSTACCIAAGLLNIAAVLIFGLHYKDRNLYSDPYGWSFVLSSVCGTLTFLLGMTVLVVVGLFGKKHHRLNDDNRYITPTEQGRSG